MKKVRLELSNPLRLRRHHNRGLQVREPSRQVSDHMEVTLWIRILHQSNSRKG